jgi:hypothetical protein
LDTSFQGHDVLTSLSHLTAYLVKSAVEVKNLDQDLRKLITERADTAGKTAMTVGSSGWLDEITVGTGEKAATYRLRSLPSLYAERADGTTIDPQSEAFRPLLHGIESQIVRYDIGVRARLTDAAVSLSLGKLALSPEGDAGNDVLANRIQIGLRLALSLNNYSRQDVKHALRRVAKAVETHTKKSGPRGYLNLARRVVRV